MGVCGYVRVVDKLGEKRTEKKALGEKRTEKKGKEKVEKKEKRTEKKELDEKETKNYFDIFINSICFVKLSILSSKSSYLSIPCIGL